MRRKENGEKARAHEWIAALEQAIRVFQVVPMATPGLRKKGRYGEISSMLFEPEK